jgi:hypothetical protein
MESLRRAMSIEPNDFRVPFLLARIDPVNGRQWLARSIAENPYDSMALIELSVWEEFSPDTSAAAERLLLQASSVDHTYGPRWALCNFYFRHNQPEKFWKWARASLDIPSETAGNKAAVFRLCWLFDPDAAKIASILPDDPLILRAYLNFLLASNHLESVAAISNRLMSSTAVTAGDADLVHMATHRLLDTAGIDAAVPVWRKMQAAGWAPLDAALPYNSRFAFPFSRSVFDWYAPEVAGVSFVQNESGVEFAFSGDEPERCGLLRQYVALGGGRYAAQCEFETRGMRSDGTGLRWHIFNGAGSEISVSPEMADAAQTPQQIRWMFAAPAGGLQPVRIDLHYERVPGTARIQGTLMLHSIRLNRTG